MPRKLSIMDILEAHFLDKKSASRLYFKVDLSDEIESSHEVQLNMDNSSFAKSCINKTL